MKRSTDKIITFYSTRHALRAEKVLKDAGLKIKIIAVPREISSSCGIAFKFASEKEEPIIAVLSDAGVDIQGVHESAVEY